MNCEFDFSFRDKFIKMSLYVTVAIGVFLSSIMLAYAGHKTIIMDEEEIEEIVETEEVKASRWHIDLDSLSGKKGENITFLVPSYIDNEDVSINMNYADNTLTVTVPDTKESYFLSNPPKGDFEYVRSAEGVFNGTDTTISLALSETLIPKISYYNNEVRIALCSPSSIKEESPIVILDPGHGGAKTGTVVGNLMEKETTLKICKYVEDLSEDKPYTVILTRETDVYLNTQERINSVLNTCADYYIGIHLSSNAEDTKLFGMESCYNDVFYHNTGIENVNFANAVLLNSVMSTNDLAIGLRPAGAEELILQVLYIPATVLYAGYMSNEEEASLLGKSDYLYKIAEGIVAALDEVIVSEVNY